MPPSLRSRTSISSNVSRRDSNASQAIETSPRSSRFSNYSHHILNTPSQSTNSLQGMDTPSSEGFVTEEEYEEESVDFQQEQEEYTTRINTTTSIASPRRARPSSASSTYRISSPSRKAVSRTPTRSSPRTATTNYKTRSGLRSRNTQTESMTQATSRSPVTSIPIVDNRRGNRVKARAGKDQNLPLTPQSLPRSMEEVMKKLEKLRENRTDDRDICSTLLPKPTKKSRSPKRASTSKVEKSFTSELNDSILFFVRMIYYFTRLGFQLLKKPLAWILMGYVVAILLAFGAQQFTNAFTRAITPMCSVPGLSTLVPICRWVNKNGQTEYDLPAWPNIPQVLTPWTMFKPHKRRMPDFPTLTHVQSHLNTVLASAEISSIMGLELKNAEISVRDLSTLVKVSNLDCRESLTAYLDEFVQDSKTVSLELSRFESKVGGTIDTMVAVNRYSVKTLQDAKERASIAAASSGGLFGLILAPFRVVESTAIEAKIQQSFVDTSSVLEDKLRYLIMEAQIVLQHLDGLETKLTTISEVVASESGRVDNHHDEILADLWTKLGGNKRKLKNLEGHKALLENVGQYRSQALTQVSNTLLQLQEMYTDLEQIRDKYAEPLVASEEFEKGNIPIEVQIAAVQEGVKRMVDRRERTKQRQIKDAADILRKVGARDPNAVVQKKIVGGEGDEVWGTKYATGRA